MRGDVAMASTLMSLSSSTNPIHAFFNGVWIADTWYYSKWFGYYSHTSNGDFVYHNTFGWIYVGEIRLGAESGVWLHNQQLRWMYVFKPADPATAGGFTLSFAAMPADYKSAYYQNSNSAVRWFLLWGQGYWVSIPDKKSATQPDFDRDGMGDWWEIDYFGDLRRDGSGDFDRDGITD